jgi:3',5'-cyclic AMP phosphodiesterase CpdA
MNVRCSKVWHRKPIVSGVVACVAAICTLAACDRGNDSGSDGGRNDMATSGEPPDMTSTAEPDMASSTAPQIAFMADVHLQDVYGNLGDFTGLPNTKSHKNATVRTMYAQLTSTRLFNENYFAFRAALDDAFARGVRHVALAGDYTDDAQPININGLKAILDEYKAKGMRFFIAPGNHDPNEPFEDEGSKDDFLGVGGKNQRVYSPNKGQCIGTQLGHVPDKEHPDGLDVVCTDQIKEWSYEDIITKLADYGYMPSQKDLYWESPFSKGYDTSSYSYAAALAEADVSHRQFEICNEGEGGAYKQADYTNCATVPDASYLVEPIEGVWLLSIDANVYQPKAKAAFDPANPRKPGNYNGSGDAGYNYVRTHKKHLVEWIATVTQRAKAQGKQLVSFAHFPLTEFYNGQSDNMTRLFKPGAFQMARRPSNDTTQALAATGLRLHIAGHMHFNNTGIYPHNGGADAAGHFLVNIQSPSLGVFGSAYKIVTLKDADTVDVQTVALDQVPRFDELFEHYETEWQRLSQSTAPEDQGHLWKKEILQSKDFHAFTRFYFGELSRLRFLGDYWPCTLKEAATNLNLAQMLILSQLQTEVTLAQLEEVSDVVPLTGSCAVAPPASSPPPVAASQLRADWQAATANATQLATAAGFTLDDFAKVSAYEFYGDFHRTAYAGELALRDMGADRVKQYKVLMAAFPANPAPIVKVGDAPSNQNAVNTIFQSEFKQLFSIFKALGSGNPSDHFVIDFKAKTVTNASPNALSFN